MVTQSAPQVERTAATPRRKTVPEILEQFALFAMITVPFCLTLSAAVALTRGKVSWFYPVASLAAASIANLGTTAGYHRMLTHQAFKAHPVVQYVLLILGAIAGMGSPVRWAHNHIHHHSHSDTEDDIHSPHTLRFQGKKWEGLLQWADAHMGWTFRQQPTVPTAKSLEVTNTPAAQFVGRTATLWLLASLVVPMCFGWNAFLWLGAVRLFLSHHITWCVNSICHMWGQQPFPGTKDKSRNNVIVGVLAMGEGWHNNHHFRPTSARHGLLPGQLDLTYALICLLERCKLVSQVQRFAQCPECREWRSSTVKTPVLCRKCQKAT